MELFVTGLHVVLCLFLILVVLLQPGKGADFGAALGGSSQDLIGAGTGVSLLGRLTALVAGLFMMTSLGLAYFSNAPADDSLDIEALEQERGASAADTATTDDPAASTEAGSAEAASEPAAAEPAEGASAGADSTSAEQPESAPADEAAPEAESAPSVDPAPETDEPQQEEGVE